MASPTWVEPVLATLSDERDLSDEWVLERKLDGVRCLAFVQAGSVELRSRNRLPLVFPAIALALEPLRDAIVDGEIVAVLYSLPETGCQGRLKVGHSRWLKSGPLCRSFEMGDAGSASTGHGRGQRGHGMQSGQR